MVVWLGAAPDRQSGRSVRRQRTAREPQRNGSAFFLGVEQALVELHAERETEALKLLLDLVKGLLAEIPVFEHLLLGLHRELADSGDIGVVEAVGGADRELDLVDRHIEQLAKLVLLVGDLVLLAVELILFLAGTVEDVEVVLENGRALLERVVGRDT